MTEPLPAWKKGLVISLALSIVASLFILIYYFEEETLESLLLFRMEYLLAAGLMVLLLWVIEGLRIKLLVLALAGDKSITLTDGMQVFLATFFFASVTPFHAGEWPAHIYGLNRKGLSIGESSAVTLTRSFLTKLVLTASAIALLVLFRGQLVPNFLNQVFVYAVFVSTCTVLLLLFFLWKPEVLNLLLLKVVDYSWGKYFFLNTPRGNRIYVFLMHELQDYLQATRSINRLKAVNLIFILILTIAYWFCFFSIAPVLLLGLNKTVPFFQSLAWVAVIQMIIIYVPVPGGSAFAEFSLASLFMYFVPSSALGIFVMSWRFFTYYVMLFFGGIVSLGGLKS